jgi:copper resistance protein C
VGRLLEGATVAGAVAAALLAGLVAGLPPLGLPSAAAHAIVLESVPVADAVLDRAPERITLRFNSKIEKRLSRISLSVAGGRPEFVPVASDGAGAAEPDRLLIPLRPLGAGKYVLRYKVLSADGHITEGALRFTVTGR